MMEEFNCYNYSMQPAYTNNSQTAHTPKTNNATNPFKIGKMGEDYVESSKIERQGGHTVANA